MLLFHHRYPTSTVNQRKAAHPFSTGDYFGTTSYVLVHNGVIRNARERRTAHEALGIEYRSDLDDGSWNDSESLLWDIALYHEGKLDSVPAYGDIAFICIKLVDGVPERMLYGRNAYRPLKLQRSKHGLMLSSEGKGDSVPINELYNYHYKSKRLTHKPLTLRSYAPVLASGYSAVSPNSCGGASYPNYRSKWGDAYQEWQDQQAEEDAFFINQDGYAEYPDPEGRYTVDGSVMWQGGVKYVWDSDLGDWRLASQTSAELVGDILARNPLTPTAAQIENKLLAELSFAEGNYLEVEVAMEQRLAALNALSVRTVPERKEMVLLKYCLDNLTDDPDYVDETSVHALWVATDDDKRNLLVNYLQTEAKKYAV